MYTIIDFILHIDAHLLELIAHYGNAVYAFLFLIIFVETGLVIMPFLPGDSLLFVAGAFCAAGVLKITPLFLILFSAAVIGDAVNYAIGKFFGTRALTKLVKKEHIEKTENFYKEYGKKTIIIARFIPIVRTLAPFVAGVGKMNYPTFFMYNIVGALIWVCSLTAAGYFFGSIPFIKDNLTLIVIGIIILSLLPALWHVIKNRGKPV